MRTGSRGRSRLLAEPESGRVLDQVERISAAKDEMVWLDLSGGEPFLRRDIDRICHQFIDRNRVRVLVGLGVCSHDASALETAVFSEVVVEGAGR